MGGKHSGMAIERTAPALFRRNSRDYAEPMLVEEAWLSDADVRSFWLEQAAIVAAEL